ncbi:MAG TPA: VOC family protein [Ktedonobacteraceae bacterium]|nr:VOC family protein [Ktedonobacteraceae bacterium]
MTRINAYLGFNGNCREAMTFYQACLGGELTMQTFGESPMADQVPAEAKQNILHSSLTKGALVLLGSDMGSMGSEGFVKGNTITLCLDCSSEEEIQTFFTKLSAGGHITHPLKTEFWGGTFGDLTDKFGMNWMFSYDKNAQA